jgi:acyl-CoA synthetase (AMP-forming)/AMP-acid ligase II
VSDNFNSAFDDIVSSLEDNKGKVAIVDRNGTNHTYADFKQMITGTREELYKRGVKKGTKVLVFISMSVELYAALEALFSLGAVTIFLDPWMGGRKMNGIIREVQPEILLLNKKAAKFSWLLPSTWFIKKWKIKELPRNNDDLKIADISGTDTALVTFTSGSTGKPKGANRTFEFIDAQAKALKGKLIGNPNEQNIDYTNLPIIGLAGFAVGNTVVLPKVNLMQIDKADPVALGAHLKSTKVNRLVVSPALLDKILVGIQGKESSLKSVATGGGPVSPKTIQKCVEQFPKIEFKSMYGSTEAEPICSASMTDIWSKMKEPLKGLFVGQTEDKIEVAILRPVDAAMDTAYFESNQLPNGEIGEILVHGKFVNKGYYKNEQAFLRHKVIDNEQMIWHRTGDLGYIENGCIYLVGRENRIVVSNGTNYYPFPIEQFVQLVFQLDDVGYVQDLSGKIILYIGSVNSVDVEAIRNGIMDEGYPIDEVRLRREALPRDPRHKSKLLTEELIK